MHMFWGSCTWRVELSQRQINCRLIHNYKILLRVFLQKYKYRCCLAMRTCPGSYFPLVFGYWKRPISANLKVWHGIMRRSNRNFNISPPPPPPGKPRAFDYFLCPGVGNLTGKALQGVGNLTLPGWGGEN